MNQHAHETGRAQDPDEVMVHVITDHDGDYDKGKLYAAVRGGLTVAYHGKLHAVEAVEAARREGYKAGLDQGHHDAYMDMLPPCPDCGKRMPYAEYSHSPGCPNGRRG